MNVVYLNIEKQKKKKTKLSPKPRFSFPLKTILWSLALIFLLSGFAVSVIFSNQKQLCNYQRLVESGTLSYADDSKLCPNLLTLEGLVDGATNIFKVNAAQFTYNSDGASSPLTPDKQACTDQLDPKCWLASDSSALKSSGNFTNFLLVGIDERPGWKLQNTDTIVVISLDKVSGKLMLISFPRDLYISYKLAGKGWRVSSKINAVYANGGMDSLKGAVEEIIGRDIHYHAMINLQIFNDIVEKLGGVDITLKQKFADVYPCKEVPKGKVCRSPRYVEDGMYGYYEFPAGKNHFDSFEATVFARSRKYSSDYQRAQRQQQLIKAVISNAINDKSPLLQKIQNYVGIYSSIKDKVNTDIQFSDISALLSLNNKISADLVPIVVDPNLAGGSIITGGEPTFRDPTYKTFQNYVKEIWTYLPYYIEKPNILIVSNKGTEIPENIKKIIAKGLPYAKVSYKSVTAELPTNVRVYDLTGGKKPGSLRDLQSRIKDVLIYNPVIDGIDSSSYKTDILVTVN